jgi:hypothetical protein
VVPQALDDRGGEVLTASAAPALAVEDAGDLRVGVVGGQPAHQCDGVLAGADLGGMGAGQGDVELADRPAAPAHGQVGLGGVAVDVDDDLLKQRAQQLLAVPVGGGRRGPDPRQVTAEGTNRRPFRSVKVLGRRRSRLASSASAAASAASLASQSRSRPRATRRLSGSTARYRRSALVAW